MFFFGIVKNEHRIPNGLKIRIRHIENKKKAKKLWSEPGKNFSREELNILAKAAGIQYYSKYKKHELALKLGVGNCEWKNLRKEILNDILEELQTKSLKELFLETSDKEKRMKEAKDALKKMYEDLHFYEIVEEPIFEKEIQEIIDEFENDYLNYIQGGEGFIFEMVRG